MFATSLRMSTKEQSSCTEILIQTQEKINHTHTQKTPHKQKNNYEIMI